MKSILRIIVMILCLPIYSLGIIAIIVFETLFDSYFFLEAMLHFAETGEWKFRLMKLWEK